MIAFNAYILFGFPWKICFGGESLMTTILNRQEIA